MSSRQHFWVPENVEFALIDLVFSGLQLPPKASQSGSRNRDPCQAFTDALAGCLIKNNHRLVKQGVPVGQAPAGQTRLLINPNLRARNHRLQEISGDTGTVPESTAADQRTFDGWLATLSDLERREASAVFTRARAIALVRLPRHGRLLSSDPGGRAAAGPAAAPAPNVSSQTNPSIVARDTGSASAADARELSGTSRSSWSPRRSLPRSANKGRNMQEAGSDEESEAETQEGSVLGGMAEPLDDRGEAERGTSALALSNISNGSHLRHPAPKQASGAEFGPPPASAASTSASPDFDTVLSEKVKGKRRAMPLIKRSESMESEDSAAMPPPASFTSLGSHALPTRPSITSNHSGSSSRSLSATSSGFSTWSTNASSVTPALQSTCKRKASTELDSSRCRTGSAPEPPSRLVAKQEELAQRSSSVWSSASQREQTLEAEEDEEQRARAYLARRMPILTWVIDLIIEEGYCSRAALQSIKQDGPRREKLLDEFFKTAAIPHGKRLSPFIQSEIRKGLEDAENMLDAPWT